MEYEGCCRSFCDGCPWAEEQKMKLFEKHKEKKKSPDSESTNDSNGDNIDKAG